MLPMITRRSYKPFLWSGFLDDGFFPVVPGRSTSMPAVNIKEDEKRFTLDLAIPGIDKKDLKIEINEDVITISSEHSEEKSENRDDFKRREFSYSSFCRSFYLPENVKKDKIEAGYKDGILSVVLPKDEEEKAKLSREVKIS
jgi:HSP20 family protein